MLNGRPNEENKDNFLLRLKKKLSDRHIYSIMVVILSVIVGIAIYFYKEKANYESYLQNTFQQSFYESMQYIEDTDNLLSKINVTNKPKQRVKIFSDLHREASAAQSNMARLPYDQATVSQVLKYLTQVSDFSYAMLLKSANDENLAEDEVKQLKGLANYSNILTGQMQKIKASINDGNRINWKEIRNEGQKALQGQTAASALGSMAGIQKDFQNYPSLVYDGPFSDHIRVMDSLFLKDKPIINKEKAQEIAAKFLGLNTQQNLQLTFSTDNKLKNVIPVYRFGVKQNGTNDFIQTIDITQQGGYPIFMLNYRTIQDNGQRVNTEELKNKLKTFLDKNGFKNMVVNYFETTDNTIVYNFSSEQQGVIIYPDLIKIKASLTNGEIIGFEANGYLMAHTDRKLAKINITEQEARDEVNKDFKIDDVRLAIIPMESKREVLCYEVRGSIGGKNYLVYINATTGRYENVLQLIVNKGGVFTQ